LPLGSCVAVEDGQALRYALVVLVPAPTPTPTFIPLDEAKTGRAAASRPRFTGFEVPDASNVILFEEAHFVPGPLFDLSKNRGSVADLGASAGDLIVSDAAVLLAVIIRGNLHAFDIANGQVRTSVPVPQIIYRKWCIMLPPPIKGGRPLEIVKYERP
jgi:hypothetical protein